MIEKWKELQGKREVYLISNLGNVKTKSRQGRYHFIDSHELKKHDNGNGYFRVMLSLPNRSGAYYIHRLVAELFIDNPQNKKFVNHKDGNKHNNCVYNLEWCTRSENEKHAWKIGLKNKDTIGVKGERHGMHKLTQKQIDYIRAVHKPFDKFYGSKGLAEMFNVCPQTITNIVNNHNWI